MLNLFNPSRRKSAQSSGPVHNARVIQNKRGYIAQILVNGKWEDLVEKRYVKSPKDDNSSCFRLDTEGVFAYDNMSAASDALTRHFSYPTKYHGHEFYYDGSVIIDLSTERCVGDMKFYDVGGSVKDGATFSSVSRMADEYIIAHGGFIVWTERFETKREVFIDV